MAKRILIFTNHYFPEQFKINDLVNWLSQEDFEIRVVTGLPNYPDGKVFKGYNIFSNFFRVNRNKKIKVNRLFLIPRMNGSYPMIALNYLSYFISCFFFTLFLSIFKKKYDIVFVHHTSPFFIALHPILYGLFHKSKKIIWELDLWPDTLRDINLIKSKYIFKLIEKIIINIYSHYDAIFVASSSFKKIISKRFNKEIRYFPNWANDEIENSMISDIDLKLPKDLFKIMYTGNIGSVQNFDQLLNTMDSLKDEKIHWIFIGDGRYKSVFQKSINDRNLNKNSSFISRVNISEIASYANHADCMYLSLKNSEIFKKTVPAKLQTYLALGKPILAVISGEGASIIKDANCGFVNEDNDFDDFTRLVLKMSKLSEKEINKMGENSIRFYNTNFSSSKRKKELLEFLNEV